MGSNQVLFGLVSHEGGHNSATVGAESRDTGLPAGCEFPIHHLSPSARLSEGVDLTGPLQAPPGFVCTSTAKWQGGAPSPDFSLRTGQSTGGRRQT